MYLRLLSSKRLSLHLATVEEGYQTINSDSSNNDEIYFEKIARA